MKMLAHSLNFVLLLSSSNVQAQGFKEYHLKKGSTISELLTEELNLWPIYGRDRYLDKVLALNNLDEFTARSLPTGKLIKVPEEFLKKEIKTDPLPEAPVAVETPPEPEAIPEQEPEPAPVMEPEREPISDEPLTSERFAGAELGWYSYTGKSPDEGSFSASGNYVAFNLQNYWKRANWMYEAEGRAALFCLICGSENVLLPTFELDGSAQWLFKDNLAIGPGAGLARNFYIFGEDGNDERVYGLVPRLFLKLFWKPTDKYFVEAKAGMTWPTEIEDIEVEPEPFFGLEFFRQLNPSWSLGGSYRYESREVESFEQTFGQFGLEIKRDF